MTTPSPKIATRKPFYRELTKGQRIVWCACGRSTNQPFCDGKSHAGSGIQPLTYRAAADMEVLLCGCKQTGTPPFCDGAHSNLAGGYEDGADLPEVDAPPLIVPDDSGVAKLDGSCFVVTPSVGSHGNGPCRISPLVLRDRGAEHQSQFHLELDDGASPTLRAQGDVVIWIAAGTGRIVIGGREFAITQPCGVHVCRGEPFHFEGEGFVAYISVCPLVDTLEIVADGTDPTFDESLPERVGSIDHAARQAMGPRFFQVLLDDRHGLDNSAQFIGHIPLSKAAMHRHLYEEALIIVSGEGTIWNENSRARVRAGDVIFFPRKHVHSLQCTSPEGMDVLGFIHPGTNPGINY